MEMPENNSSMNTTSGSTVNTEQYDFEVRCQELHSARMQNDLLAANLSWQEGENKELKKEIAELKKAQDDWEKSMHERANSYSLQISSLQQELDEAAKEIQNKEEENGKLKELLQAYQEHTKNDTMNITSSSFLSDVDSLLLEIEGLKTQKTLDKAKHDEEIANMSKQLGELSDLREQVKEYEEETECLQAQFNSQCNITEDLRQRLQDLKEQQEADAPDYDGNRKGNSLFAEVEDRRVVAEKKTVTVVKRLAHVEEQLSKEQKENKRLESRLRFLRQSASQGYDEKTVQSLKQQLEDSKKNIVSLTAKLKKGPQAQVSTVEPVLVPPPREQQGSDQNFVSYLNTVITQLRKKLNEYEKKNQQFDCQLVQYDLLLTQSKNKVITLTNERDQLKVMNSHLSMNVQDLERKLQPDEFEGQAKDKKKIAFGRETKSKVLNDSEPLKEYNYQEKKKLDSVATVKGTTGSASDGKENDLVKFLLGGTETKSVKMKTEMDVISPSGARTVKSLHCPVGGNKTSWKGGKMTMLKGKPVTFIEADDD